ncbi:helix-turn-helix domain-containing protein [Akkermansia muciniphila]|uniref:helix-turn-helix domain-containing protein n=1 Tax=Akkermansia muciniphila TaxID=239935 RepID=UPI0033BA0B7F
MNIEERKMLHLIVLAGDCAACSVTPPIQPTMSSVMRMLGLLGAMTLSELADIIPCSLEALRQQLSRLMRCGLVSKKVEKRDGKPVGMYKLTPSGTITLQGWMADTEKFLKKITQPERK